MKFRLLLVPLLALSILSTACATSNVRKLALVDYQTAQATTDAQASAETANRGGALPAMAYSKFLLGASEVTKAGQVYSAALVAYIADHSAANSTALSSALAALSAAFLKLPSTLAGTSTQPAVADIVNGKAPQKAIADGQAVLGAH